MENQHDWHLHDVDVLAQHHGVNVAHGLHEEEVSRRILHYGPNVIKGRRRPSPLHILARQFNDFMILVLVAAALVSGLVGDVVDTLVILAIVLLNALIGFVQNWRADRAIAALQQLASAHATVLRGGKTKLIPASEVVPGDIVLLEAGNHIPADLRLFHIAQLKVDESALTGESVTVEKHTLPLTASASALADRLNMAFKGTIATHGRGCGVVVATGMATELGKIAGFLDVDENRVTPLQQRLAIFSKRLALLAIAICVVIFVAGLLRGEPLLLMAMTSLSLAVAAIPEALPAVVTVLLAFGARKMVEQNVLIRRLPSVETLGSVTFICADKTGTLTQNKMRVEYLHIDGKNIALANVRDSSVALEVLRSAVLCNDATRDTEQQWLGDPTETALTRAAAEAGFEKSDLDVIYKRVAELPFDSQRKCMTTVHQVESGFVSYTKGAPEAIIPHCLNLDRDLMMATANAMAADGLRVLAFARKNLIQQPQPRELEALETGLSFLGLIALIDPPRDEAFTAVADCLSAGITPVMITGDHPATALAIARRLGIVDAHHTDVITGQQLALMEDEQLRQCVGALRVYARVDPAQKIRIVAALQAQGEFVAMTGDGVNDAPALKRADIGVAMGRGGTDVAREASSLVLLDDNFASIVAAVREGRRIYDNIRKFVRYALTANSSEVWIIFLAPFLLLPIPLLPIHILWVNLVTDGLPGLALAAEPAERGIMQRPPRPPQQSLFAGLWQHILVMGLLMASLCLLIQAWAITHGHNHWQTMVFTALTFSQMAYVLSIRSESESLFRVGLLSNCPLLAAVLVTFILQLFIIYMPALNVIFKTAPLTLAEFILCFSAALIVFAVVEFWKYFHQEKTPR